MLGRNVQIQKQVKCPQIRQNCHEKLMKGRGPIGEFLYEVGEMKIGSQMGKLMVDEMVGS
jgi:hypothetical protein